MWIARTASTKAPVTSTGRSVPGGSVADGAAAGPAGADRQAVARRGALGPPAAQPLGGARLMAVATTGPAGAAELGRQVPRVDARRAAQPVEDRSRILHDAGIGYPRPRLKNRGPAREWTGPVNPYGDPGLGGLGDLRDRGAVDVHHPRD